MKSLLKFRRNQDGATAIEYGLIAGLIAIVIIGGAGLAGGSLDGMFTTVSTELDAAAGGGGGGNP